jgi:short-subunit dehydrogenase
MTNGVAVVTGASSGLGAEFARQLAARGLRVLAVARRKERLVELAEEVRRAGKGELVPLELDVTSDGAARIIAERARALGPLAWLVDNAGTDVLGPVADLASEKLAALVRLNCESVVAVTSELVPDLIARKSGHVIVVASVAGFQPTPYHATYGATKAFLISFSEALSEELRDTGVRVTALCPGPVSTEIFDHLAPGVAREQPRYELSAKECVRFALEAADAGRVIAIPGRRNRFMALTSKLAPRALVRRISAKIGISYMGYDPKQLAH